MTYLALALAVGLSAYGLGYVHGNRYAWRMARWFLEHYGRLPLEGSTVLERRRARRREPSDRLYTIVGAALIALVLTAGAFADWFASALGEVAR
ncbi:MAG: hypothetical protein ACF8PN_05060 [Phycisphaerales bacterium]